MATESYKASDGKFAVRAYTEINRHGRPQHRIRYGYRGHPPCTETAKSEPEAVGQAKLYWQAHLDGLLDAPLADPTTMADLLKRFVERPFLSPASVRSYKQACGTFVAFVGAYRDLDGIGKGTVEQWLASLTCKPVSKATYLRNLSALFKWAKREKIVREDPTAELRVQQARAGHPVRPYLQSYEWPAFLAACGATHRLRAEFVLHTGLRAGELVDARWDWLHGMIGRQALMVPACKSARARSIPLDQRAIEILAEAREKLVGRSLVHMGALPENALRPAGASRETGSRPRLRKRLGVEVPLARRLSQAFASACATDSNAKQKPPTPRAAATRSDENSRMLGGSQGPKSSRRGRDPPRRGPLDSGF